MTFDQDYLADLESVIVELFRCGSYQVAEQIEDCKAAGSTGGEILDCVTFRLREAMKDIRDDQAQTAINEYLKRARRRITD